MADARHSKDYLCLNLLLSITKMAIMKILSKSICSDLGRKVPTPSAALSSQHKIKIFSHSHDQIVNIDQIFF